jgi:hypothetical protein
MFSPKTGALFFDRIWGGYGAPDEVGFYGHTDYERFCMLAIILRGEADRIDGLGQRIGDADASELEEIARELAQKDPKRLDMIERLNVLWDAFEKTLPPDTGVETAGMNTGWLRRVSGSLWLEKQIAAPVVYSSEQTFYQEYQAGSYEVLVSTLSELNLVDEDRIQWEQVLEFRHDELAKKKFRRLRHWLHRGRRF